MNHPPKNQSRRSMRLQDHDYSKQGAYFITICTHQHKCLFGKITNDEMVLNPLGMIVREEWMQSSHIRTEIEMDECIVMPNHLHGIVFIQGIGISGRAPRAPTLNNQHKQRA